MIVESHKKNIPSSYITTPKYKATIPYQQLIYNKKNHIFMLLKHILADNKYSQILADIFSRIKKLASIITTHEDLSKYVFDRLCNEEEDVIRI